MIQEVTSSLIHSILFNAITEILIISTYQKNKVVKVKVTLLCIYTDWLYERPVHSLVSLYKQLSYN